MARSLSHASSTDLRTYRDSIPPMSAAAVTFTDEDIFAKLTDTEDATVERKLHNDKKKDWVKTVVAFSNSLADGQPGILFIGARDDGRIEEGQAQKTNFADFQKKVSGVIADIYPPVYPTILSRKKDGLEFLVVIVYGSPNRPHFAGKSYRRDGTQSVDASEEHIEEFIARRSSKFVEIVKHKDETVTLSLLLSESHRARSGGTYAQRIEAQIVVCNQHFITLKYNHQGLKIQSYPLRIVEISFDNPNNRFELIVQAL
jgi:hypothetical protein